MEQERFIVGQSEDTEAEYGFRSDRPVSVLHMYQGDVFCVEGFASIKDAIADLKAGNVQPSQIERL